MSNSFKRRLIPVINGTNETNIIPPQDLRPHAPVVRNQQGFVGSIITNYCNSMIMIFTCVTDIHNNWITLINLAANSLIAESHALEISCTCFCGGDKTILANDLVKNAANKPRISAFFASVAILAGNLLNCGINLWHRFGVCKIEVSHRSKRRQSAIIIFTIVILVKTTKIFKLISCQAITLLYDLLLRWSEQGDLNVRSPHPKCGALPTRLYPDICQVLHLAPDESNAMA